MTPSQVLSGKNLLFFLIEVWESVPGCHERHPMGLGVEPNKAKDFLSQRLFNFKLVESL